MIAGGVGALQFPTAMPMHEALIAVVEIDGFAGGKKGMQFGAHRLVFAKNAALAGGRREWPGQDAHTAALAALGASRAKQLPAKAPPTARQEITVFDGI